MDKNFKEVRIGCKAAAGTFSLLFFSWPRQPQKHWPPPRNAHPLTGVRDTTNANKKLTVYSGKKLVKTCLYPCIMYISSLKSLSVRCFTRTICLPLPFSLKCSLGID